MQDPNSGQMTFRLLCQSSRIGGVIGKSGSIIKLLQQSTSCKIKIEDPPTPSDDRIITISGSNSLTKTITFPTEQIQISPAQEALLRVFERVLEVAAEVDGEVQDGTVVGRMIVMQPQAGAVIGKEGKMVESIRRSTKTWVRVLGLDKSLLFPSAFLPPQEIIEIEGDALAVKRALVAVSRCIQDCPPIDITRSRLHEAIPHECLPNSSVGHPSVSQPFSLENGRAHTMESRTPMSPQQEVVFRILCSSDRVGCVIGKGGTVVRAIQNETGASISVGTSVDEHDEERLITITAFENPESQYSPALNAAVRVFSRSVDPDVEKGLDVGSVGSSVSARLVVSPNQVGCLLGKGGAIVSEMRKLTRTSIWITAGNEHAIVPENDQVVQIVGYFINVQDALYKVGSRLRANLSLSKMLNGIGTIGSSSFINNPNPYDNARNHYSLGLQSPAVSHDINQHLCQSMERLGLSNKKVAVPNPRSSMDVGRESTTIQGGLELGSSGFAAKTMLEIPLPEHVIDSVYGENGSNLARLREISGAHIVVSKPLPGASDPMVVIYGSPNEVQTAQSLVHAFILTGS